MHTKKISLRSSKESITLKYFTKKECQQNINASLKVTIFSIKAANVQCVSNVLVVSAEGVYRQYVLLICCHTGGTVVDNNEH